MTTETGQIAVKEYDVTLTLRLSTRVTFARDTEAELEGITKADARDNGIGSLPFGLVEMLEGEGWSVALPIDAEAAER